jgi:glycosyltransferase involved in cell wall biosynthesis
MKKSVAIVTPTFPPYRGGIGTVAGQDARALASLGFDVHVYAPTAAGAESRRAGEPQDEPPYSVHRLRPWLRIGNGAFLPSLGGLLKRHDLVVLQYPFFGGAEPIWFAKRFGGKNTGKLALVYHMDVEGAGWLRPFIAAHRRLWMPGIIRAADAVIVTSRDYALHSDIASTVSEDVARFAELPPSVDVARFFSGPKSEALLKRYGIGVATPVVTFVGGLDTPHYFKGVSILLTALADEALHGVHAVIVGEGNLRPSFEAQARQLGIAGRVTFGGNVSDAELPDHYRLGDVFAFPSLDRSEAFGIVALEAAACGIPVVASDLPGVRTVVRDGETGKLVPPGSVSALASALSALLADEALRRRLGAAGRSMAVADYAVERRPERWRKIIADFHLL